MKKSLLMVAVLVSGSTFAAQTTESDLRQSSNSKLKVHQGVRVSAGVGSNNYEVEARIDGKKSGSINENGNSRNLSIGYENINIQNVGFMGELNIGKAEVNDEDVDTVGFEVNATYGLNDVAYLYGGLNLSSIEVEDSGDFDFDTGLGLQGAVGFKLAPAVSVELKYKSTVYTANYTLSGYSEASYNEDSYSYDYSYDTYEVDAELVDSVLQLNLIGTF